MALIAKMLLRQGQSLAMTPQLLQAIKLLQYSGAELAAYVEEELERNPLLERAEEGPDPAPTGIDAAIEPDAGAATANSGADPGEGDWATSEFATTPEGMTESLGAEVGNAFDGDRDLSPAAEQHKLEAMGLSDTAWSGVGGGDSTREPPNIEAYVASQGTLADFLGAQLAIATQDPVERMIGLAVIDAIDEAGYLRESAEEIAERLGVARERVEKTIALVQTFEPTGIGARDLAECLALQLRERDRFDPAMAAMVAHLPLVAKRDFAALRRICGVDDEDLKDMMAEIRRLDPKPGRAFGEAPVRPVAPDVIVRAARDGSWRIELNSETLPRVLVNRTYATKISRNGGGEEDKSFLSQCLQSANWLTKALEQRARTILKVSAEIVRRQDAFLAQGVAHLKPLNLKNVADAVGLHEIDGFAGDVQQIHFDAARPVRAEIFLHRLDRRPWRRRRPFGGSGAFQDQADDRRRGARRHPLRRRHRRKAQGAADRHRPAHGREISRKPAHSFLGRTPARETGDGPGLSAAATGFLLFSGNPRRIGRPRSVIDFGRGGF